MKKILLPAIIAAMFCSTVSASTPGTGFLTERVSFPESVYPYKGGTLISNFGSMSPQPYEYNGYVLFRDKKGKVSILIPSSSKTLHKPTAMAIKEDHLFICDDTVLKIYEMKNLDKRPRIINFPFDTPVVNDIVLDGNDLYISITNHDQILKLDVSNPKTVSEKDLTAWLNVPGPNGIDIHDGQMFIASIPHDYRTLTPANVIYRVPNVRKPTAEIFYNVPAAYDGVVVSKDGKTLFISDWTTSSIHAIDMKSKTVQIFFSEPNCGFADIAVTKDRLIVPDFPHSRIIFFPIK